MDLQQDRQAALQIRPQTGKRKGELARHGLRQMAFQGEFPPIGERQDGHGKTLGPDVIVIPAMPQEAAERFERLVDGTSQVGIVIDQDDAQPGPVRGLLDEKRMPRKRVAAKRELLRELARIEECPCSRPVGVQNQDRA